jgi:predicted secreted protein
MNRLLGCLFLMVTICLSLCLIMNRPVLARENQETVTIDWKDNNKVIRLTEGQVLQVLLNAKPGTGYRWRFVNEPQANVLKFITRFEEATSNLLGAPVKEHLVFYAVRAGETAIHLAYSRSWESKAVKNFSVKIVIK